MINSIYRKTISHAINNGFNSLSKQQSNEITVSGNTRKVVDFFIPDSVGHTGLNLCSLNLSSVSFISLQSDRGTLIISGVELFDPLTSSAAFSSGITLNASNDRKSVFIHTGNGLFENSDGISLNSNSVSPIEGFWIKNISSTGINLKLEYISNESNSSYGIPD